MVGRGPNKKQIKGVKVGQGKYRLGTEQQFVHNLKRKFARSKAKVERLNHQTKLLQTSIDKLTLDLLQKNARYFRRASKKVLNTANNPTLRPFSPVSIALAQLEQESYTLNLSAVEKMREIVLDPTRSYQRSLLPARASVQRIHTKLAAVGEDRFKPAYSANQDIVTLDTRSVVEAIIDTSEWPGIITTSDDSPTETRERVESLPILSIDATADGAKLTASRGMIVHGLKLVSPTLVHKLVPKTKRLSSEGGSTSATAVTVVQQASGDTSNDDTTTNGEILMDVVLDESSNEDSNLDDEATGGSNSAAVMSPAVDNDEILPTAMMHLDISTELNSGLSRMPSTESPMQEPTTTSSSSAVVATDPVLSNNDAVEENEAVEGVQSVRTVLLTGFCHGSDNDIVDGEFNYNR